MSCNSSILTSGGNNSLICHAVSGYNTTTNAAITANAGGTAIGNIDPLYGQYFTGVISTANAGYGTPQTLLSAFGTTPAVQATSTNMSGLSVISQLGWGGQLVNVSLGPQTAANQGGLNVVWGVHATPTLTARPPPRRPPAPACSSPGTWATTP